MRTGIQTVGPHLIGRDPRDLSVIGRTMDQALMGHPYVKAPLDIACWDLLGKSVGEPVCRLLGGRSQNSIGLYRAISQDSADNMAANVRGYREQGYRRFQLKVGGDPLVDIERIRAVRALLDPSDILIADANTGWTRAQAAQVIAAIPGYRRIH